MPVTTSSGPPFPFARISPPLSQSTVDQNAPGTTSPVPIGPPLATNTSQIADAVQQLSSERRPLTSLNADLSNFGLPQSGSGPSP
jgi:hypothetical protein